MAYVKTMIKDNIIQRGTCSNYDVDGNDDDDGGDDDEDKKVEGLEGGREGAGFRSGRCINKARDASPLCGYRLEHLRVTRPGELRCTAYLDEEGERGRV